MSADEPLERARKEPVERKRVMKHPSLPPGPVADLNNALRALHREAGAPSMARIRDRILELAAGEEVSDPTATPSADTVHTVLTAPTPAANINHVIAVAAALLHPHSVPGVVPVVRGHPRVQEIRRLWAAAVDHVPPGRPITETPAQYLEVHRTLPPGTPAEEELPAYIPRAHDLVLHGLAAAALSATPSSGIAVLISDSTSGKTRALYEVLHHPVLPAAAPGRHKTPPRSLAEAGWRVWPPANPISARQFLAELAGVGPHTVVWLNEAQRYLIASDPDIAHAIAVGLRDLLADPRRTPVLVLGTLWPRYLDQITAAPASPQDPLEAARVLLIDHTIAVPGTFTGADLHAARASLDTRVQDALAAADAATESRGQATEVSLAQHMAGVPALLDHYRTASTTIKAVLHAAMDARRLGHNEWLPVPLLHHAAPAYLTPHEQRQHLADPQWFSHALDILTTPLHAAAARALHRPLAIPSHPTGNLVRLEDYLDQHGRTRRAHFVPPSGFWLALADHSHPDDLTIMGDAAWARGLYRDAAQLYKNAAARGSSRAAQILLDLLHALHPGDHRPAQWVIARVALDDPIAVSGLLRRLHDRETTDVLTALLERDPAAMTSMDRPTGVTVLAGRLHRIGARHQLETLLARKPADVVDPRSPYVVAALMEQLRRIGATEQSAVLARRAAASADLGNLAALGELLAQLQRSSATDHAVTLVRRAAASVDIRDMLAVVRVLGWLHGVGLIEQAHDLAARAADRIHVQDIAAVGDLLRGLHRIQATEQIHELAAQAVARIALDASDAVAELVQALHEVSATRELDGLLARQPAEHARLDDTAAVACLLDWLRTVAATGQVTVLAERAVTGTAVDDSAAVARLLDRLRAAELPEHAARLADRAVPCVALDNAVGVEALIEQLQFMTGSHRVVALADRVIATMPTDELAFSSYLITELHAFGSAYHAVALARRVCTDAPVDNPAAVAALLEALDTAGATDQRNALAARAAGQVGLYFPEAIAELLQVLHTLDATVPLAVLAERAATQVIPDNSSDARILIEQLTDVGAVGHADALANLLPALGMFDVFLNHRDHSRRFQFGRESDGSPAASWSWNDLD